MCTLTSISNKTPAPAWSKLGLGTGTLASLGRAASLSEVDRLLAAMHEIGITVIDTADSYGSGDCEVLLGKALRRCPDSFHVVTKAGYRLSNLSGPLRPFNQFLKKGLHKLGKHQQFDAKYLRQSLDHSLRRLRTERVDAFLLHDPPLEALKNLSILNMCDRLRESCKTSMVGVSSGDPDVLREAISSEVFAIIESPANLAVAHSLREIWEECEVRGIRVIANHVFAPKCLRIPGMNPETLMRASSTLLPASATILCGTRNPQHLREAYSWANNPLPVSEARELAGSLTAVANAPN